MEKVENKCKNAVRAYAEQCIKDEAKAVLELLPQLDESFDKADSFRVVIKPRVWSRP